MSASNQNRQLAVSLALVSIVVLYLFVQAINCAPNNSNNNKDNNNSGSRLLRPGLLSNLFRRQTSTSNSSNSNKDSSQSSSSSNDSSSSDSDDPGTQTELDAQKFMDSLPNSGSNSGPTSFRERVSESWGVLREGVSSQFRSLRDNWSDTVEDLRDTWTGNSD